MANDERDWQVARLRMAPPYSRGPSKPSLVDGVQVHGRHATISFHPTTQATHHGRGLFASG